LGDAGVLPEVPVLVCALTTPLATPPVVAVGVGFLSPLMVSGAGVVAGSVFGVASAGLVVSAVELGELVLDAPVLDEVVDVSSAAATP
ncbi:MAG: hypothetical protein M3O32_19470, partial [Actinomycetota bacterium]|nr:hypothetical protein [Actinomycetota bacterium]